MVLWHEIAFGRKVMWEGKWTGIAAVELSPSPSLVTFLHVDGQSCTSVSTITAVTQHSIPYSLTTRGRRIYNHPDNLRANLQPHWSLSSKNSYSMIPITTYYPGLHHLKWILREGLNIPSSDPSTKDLLNKPTLFCHILKPPTSANSLSTSLHPHRLTTLQ